MARKKATPRRSRQPAIRDLEKENKRRRAFELKTVKKAAAAFGIGPGGKGKILSKSLAKKFSKQGQKVQKSVAQAKKGEKRKLNKELGIGPMGIGTSTSRVQPKGLKVTGRSQREASRGSQRSAADAARAVKNKKLATKKLQEREKGRQELTKLTLKHQRELRNKRKKK